MPLPPISSRDNPRIKAVRALHDRRARREQGVYLVEGVTLLLDALQAGIQPTLVLRDDTRLYPAARAVLDPALAPLDDIVQPVGPAAFRAVADTEAPQGVVAVVPLPAAAPPAVAAGDLVLIADRIHDPGNLGTMLRAAEGAGVRWALTTAGTVDPFSPKVVRAGMGAHFRLPIAADLPWSRLAPLIGGRLRLLGADAGARRTYDEVDWRPGGVLVIGSEAGGLSDEALDYVDDTIAIPLQGRVESLNAAVAAAVILFEAARQRRSRA